MDFEARLRELENLAGSEISMETFNDKYQSLLLEVQRLPAGKVEKLERMRRVLHRQFLYLYAVWKRAKVIEGARDPDTSTSPLEGMN